MLACHLHAGTDIPHPKPVIAKPAQYLAGGTGSDADAYVASMRKLTQETACIDQWHEQREARYSNSLLAYIATNLMSHGMMQIVWVLYKAIVVLNTSLAH